MHEPADGPANKQYFKFLVVSARIDADLFFGSNTDHVSATLKRKWAQIVA